MRKSTLSFIALLLSLLTWAQIITTTPTFVTQNGGAVDIVFDASLGSGGLKDYAGTDVYAHTGVITTASASNTDWKHAPTWLDNSPKYLLISLGNNKWKLSIIPSLKDYYGLATGEVVTKMAFVFRNGTGAKEGKDTGGTDIVVDVFQSGLNVAFTNPTSNQTLTVGTALNFSVGASLAATTLNLYVNGLVVKTTNAATTLSHTYTFATANDYLIVAEAILGGQTVRDTIRVCVPTAVTNQARPAGVTEGINYIDSSTATLVLYAPGKTNVFVIGDFNNWTQLNAYQMKKDGEYWWYTLNGLTPAKIYGFQYLVDGVLKISDAYTEMVLDPWNDKWINEKTNIYPNLTPYPVSKTDGLVATLQTSKPAYNWEMTNFTPTSVENLVIYEVLLRDFTVEKSLNAALTKLDYLKTLGITAIELMPIQEFDGNNSWGYNPNHYFATDKAYGNSDTYKKFIDECHKRGMAVIVDVVFNHATGSNPFAKLYWDSAANKTAANNPWFNVDAPHPYSVFHDFNHSFSGTKEYFNRVLKYWLSEYKIDGYRLDLTKGFSQRVVTESNASTYDQSRIDILSGYYDAAKSEKSNVIFILEHFCNNDEETVLANKGMYLWRNVNNAYSQSAMGYSSESDFSGMNSSPRKWVGFAESHDEERNFFKVKTYGAGNLKTDSIARIARVPLNIAFATLIPGPKMIWQFGEIGYDYSINSNGGRTNEKPSAWGWLNLAHRKAAYEASAKIITLRKLYPTAFTQGNFTFNIGTSDWTSGRRISLTHSDLNLVVLGNFDATAVATANPNFPKTGTWYNALTGQQLNVTNTTAAISLQPGELLIFSDRVITFPNGLSNPISSEDIKIYPTYTKGKVFISTSTSVKNIKVYNLQGFIIKSVDNSPEIDITNTPKGLYVLEVNTLDRKTTSKIIKE
ncbi:MAG: T9SS type A sorting domain-containing protein [Paludibacter sp.]|nr:T9SS type A sorting domain-containing protein [Paludibacter sp.]